MIFLLAAIVSVPLLYSKFFSAPRPAPSDQVVLTSPPPPRQTPPPVDDVAARSDEASRPNTPPVAETQPSPPPAINANPQVIWGGDGYGTYHKPGCDRGPVGVKAKELKRSDAIEKGLTPCKKCTPETD